MPVLNWIGKDSVVTYHSKVPFRTLSLTYGYTAEHRREEGLSSESGNMIVYGDNLLSLKSAVATTGRTSEMHIQRSSIQHWREMDVR